MNLQLFNACMILPLLLLPIAWIESNRMPIEYSILTLSAILLNLAAIRGVTLPFLGTEIGSHLLATTGVNLLISIALGIYLGMIQRWIAAIAALILTVGWLLVAAENSVV
jgi:hypothetical protein